MSASGNSARASLMVQLSPSRSTKISFSVQLILTLFWLIWASMLLFSDNDQNYLYYVFFALALCFMIYVILQNTSVFGVQSYIEVTPQYIVHKLGVFRTKHIIAMPDIASIQITQLGLNITELTGAKIFLNLKQVRKKRDLDKIKSKIREMGNLHNFKVTETAVS
ncbi:hypothetical protein [Pontibacter vulgaris]|uniref:hypothetical protein n=1 Tax=Pontibacter vulgaris TaxID=2905679 RepID=UPI001FA6CE0A|nr:hypothetical protein [Pontibacter vulgaris]